MFETSLDFLYIALGIGILAVAGFISLALYRASKVMEESEKTVRSVNKKLDVMDELIEDFVPTIKALNGTVRDINEKIVRPISSLGTLFDRITRLLNIFTRKE